MNNIEWFDPSLKEQFSSINLNSYEDFMNMENHRPEVEICRIHKCRINKGETARITVRINLGTNHCFLKRGYRQYAVCIDMEERAVKKLPDFGLYGPEIACIGKGDLGGFMISKPIVGKSLFENSQIKEPHIQKIWLSCYQKILQNNWFYPEWKTKHMYLDQNNKPGLIDLERCMPLSEFGSRGKWFLGRWVLRNAEIKQLAESLQLSVAECKKNLKDLSTNE